MSLTPKEPSRFNHYGRLDVLEKALKKLPGEFAKFKADMIRVDLDNTILKQQNKQLTWKVGRLECELDAMSVNAERWADYRVGQKFTTYMQNQMGNILDKRV